MKRVHRCSTGWVFHCPGCSEHHVIPDDRGWTFNGDYEMPTFQPSVRHSRQKKGEAGLETFCHYNITGGQIVFHGGSRHKLAGQTIVMPEWTNEDYW